MARKDKPEKILKIHMKPAPRLGRTRPRSSRRPTGASQRWASGRTSAKKTRTGPSSTLLKG